VLPPGCAALWHDRTQADNAMISGAAIENLFMERSLISVMPFERAGVDEEHAPVLEIQCTLIEEIRNAQPK
jgi:hypothetical protein